MRFFFFLKKEIETIHFFLCFFVKDPSRRNSPEMDGNGREMFMVIPRERKMVSGPAIYDGMLRLNFLLEACQPGTIPDANLIAAVLDLVRI